MIDSDTQKEVCNHHHFLVHQRSSKIVKRGGLFGGPGYATL